MNAHEIELALRSRAAFNDSVDHLDTDTRRRLRDMRLHALQPRARATGTRWLWPAGAAVTAAIALAAFLPHAPFGPASPTAPRGDLASSAAPPARDARPAIAETASDLMQPPSVDTADPEALSDLEFYRWLARQPGNSSPGG